jgi:hypothetical protein
MTAIISHNTKPMYMDDVWIDIVTYPLDYLIKNYESNMDT